jgi:multiple sugar transport system ATP-binding protein
VRLGDGVRVEAVDAAAPPGTPVAVGIRPEHFVLTHAEDGIPFLLETVEPTGAETHLHGSVGGGEARVVLRERLSVRPGERLRLAVAPENVHLFDESGARL